MQNASLEELREALVVLETYMERDKHSFYDELVDWYIAIECKIKELEDAQ